MTDKPASVRIATVPDEAAVYKILSMAHEENGAAQLSPERVRDQIKFATERRGGIIGVIDGPQEIEGVIMLRLTQWWYSDDWHLDELCNFVHPDYRRGNHHPRHLIEFAKWFAEQMEQPLFIGVMTHERMEAKNRLYRRQVKMGGALFYHNLHYGLLSEAG